MKCYSAYTRDTPTSNDNKPTGTPGAGQSSNITVANAAPDAAWLEGNDELVF